MSDIFLSYATEDRSRIRHLVDMLKAAGLSVWWDRDIQAGSSYDRVIESAIADAKCVIAVWSEHSIESEYVRSEVEDAANRNILVPVLIDNVQPPLAHRRRQAVNLVDWNGKNNGEFEKLVAGVRAKISDPPTLDDGGLIHASGSRRLWATTIGLGLVVTLWIAYFFQEDLEVWVAMNFPSFYFDESVDEHLAFVTSADGTKIAYAIAGEGPPILEVLSVGTHLEKGLNAPLYDNDGLVAMSARHNLFVMYDGRGDGLSDRNVQDYSLAARVSDISAVVDAAGLDHFGILGVSAGGPAAIAYTAQHPDRVTRLVLAGTFVSMDFLQGDARKAFERQLDLVEVAWQQPEVSDMYARQLIGPDGDAVDVKIMGEFSRLAIDGPDLARFNRASLRIDVTELARKIQVPTLVLHSSTDPVIPFAAGRRLASLIPGAQFEVVDGGGHMASSASSTATRRRALEFLNGH